MIAGSVTTLTRAWDNAEPQSGNSRDLYNAGERRLCTGRLQNDFGNDSDPSLHCGVAEGAWRVWDKGDESKSEDSKDDNVAMRTRDPTTSGSGKGRETLRNMRTSPDGDAADLEGERTLKGDSDRMGQCPEGIGEHLRSPRRLQSQGQRSGRE